MDLLLRRLEMYAMINAIENDFIDFYSKNLNITDIPYILIERSQNVNDKNNLREVLRGLDLQAYIEIANKNVIKLNINTNEKRFLNEILENIIPIRNKIMHPRLLEFFDYPKLKSCFESIDANLKFISWDSVSKIKQMIETEPSQLRQYEINLKKSKGVIENLPVVADFDDTTFIGREKEVGEIKEKLFKKNVHILSILGDGGIGKTATTLKVLYDLLDDENNPFELILWVSLKTKTLDNYEFSNIKNAINNIDAMYGKLNEFIGEKGDERNNLIELSKKFRTLLVLDNLETINTEDIKSFLDQFSENGKIIITSRIGLGEMEHRYFLNGLSDSDLLLYINTLLELYNKKDFFSQEEKIYYAKTELLSNPLAIKWFVRGIANGKTAKELLNNKNELITFCLSNVYDKLSEYAKEMIILIKNIHSDVTYAELIFIIGKENYNESTVRLAINELCKCNFLNSEKFQLYEILSITEFVDEFLGLIVKEHNEEKIGRIKQKIKELNAFDQSMVEKRLTKPFALQTFYYTTNERKKVVAAYYLTQALSCINTKKYQEATELVELAKSICPNYYECNKVAAYLLQNTDITKAYQEYEIAKKNSKTDFEYRMILINYKEFCLNNNNYDEALSSLEQAILIKDEELLEFEKVKIKACIGQLDEAETLLNSIKIGNDNKYLNIALTRKADILRRRAERIRSDKERFLILKQASETILQTNNLDFSSIEYLSLVLRDMMVLYYDIEVVEYVYSIIQKYKKDLYRARGIKEVRKRFPEFIDLIPTFDSKEEFISFFKDYNEIIPFLKPKEGVVYSLERTYGFVKNADFVQGIYFSREDIKFDIQLGDIVKIGDIFPTIRGAATRQLKLIKHQY